MNEIENNPSSRIDYEGSLSPLVQDIATAYDIGEPICYSIIQTGYEDCNVIINTNQGLDHTYVAKIFSKDRKSSEITRYSNTMEEVVKAGINHPKLLRSISTEYIFKDSAASNVSLVLMNYIEGQTLLQRANRTVPTNNELELIVEQATKINHMDYKPSPIYDAWAIPNIHNLYSDVKAYLLPSDQLLVRDIIQKYDEIPVLNLPKAFVHGDISKANVLIGNDGKPYILDFSVSNIYPRIQEIAVMAADLMYDNNEYTSLQERIDRIVNIYERYLPLSALEKQSLYSYALTGIAAEFLGAHLEKFVHKNDIGETEYRMCLGRNSLQKELKKSSL